MATSPSTVELALEQMRGAGMVRARKMFGDYGIYCDDRMVGLICDDQLSVKLTGAGAALEPGLERAPPYKGAKPSMLVPPDLLEDAPRLVALVRATVEASEASEEEGKGAIERRLTFPVTPWPDQPHRMCRRGLLPEKRFSRKYGSRADDGPCWGCRKARQVPVAEARHSTSSTDS